MLSVSRHVTMPAHAGVRVPFHSISFLPQNRYFPHSSSFLIQPQGISPPRDQSTMATSAPENYQRETTATSTQAQQLLRKALLCVAPVILWLLFMATTVTARVVTNASRRASPSVQEPLLSDELVALQEIAKALNRSVELVTNNFSWLKLALFQTGVLFVIEILKIFTGVLTQFFVDLWREDIPRWKKLMHHTTEGTMGQLAAYAKEVVADLRAQLADLRAQLADLQAQVADLRAKREGETNTKFDYLEERLKVREPYRRHNLTTRIWPDVEEPVNVEEPVKEGAACASRRAAGILSD